MWAVHVSADFNPLIPEGSAFTEQLSGIINFNLDIKYSKKKNKKQALLLFHGINPYNPDMRQMPTQPRHPESYTLRDYITGRREIRGS